MTSAHSPTQYDHALAYLFYSWGISHDFSDGRGAKGGFYEHRAQTTDLLVDLIKKGNPWAPHPDTGRCAADLLWLCHCYPIEKFKQVMLACLTHPQAPDPNTWSTRRVFNTTVKDENYPIPSLWINAIAQHKQSPELAQLYVDLGGRLDAVDHNGDGLLANCGHRDWSDIEKFMRAADSKGFSITASKNGSWSSSWKHLGPAELSDVESKFSELSKKYPHATRSLISPVQEMAEVIRQNRGMRPTSAAFKRLGLDKIIQKDPASFQELFNHTLLLGIELFGRGRSHHVSTTFTYMSGALAKASVKHPDSCHYHKIFAAALSTSEIYRKQFQLLSGGVDIVSKSTDIGQWFQGMETMCQQLKLIATQQNRRYVNPMGTFLNQVNHLFHAPSSATTPAQRHEFLNQVSKNITFAPFDLVDYGDERKGHYLLVQDLLSCCDDSVPEKLRDFLVCLGLEEVGYGLGGFLPAMSLVVQDQPAPSYYTTPYEAAKWLVDTLESYESVFPDNVSKMLNHVHEKIMVKIKDGNAVSGINEVSSYLGRLRLSARAGSRPSQASTRPHM